MRFQSVANGCRAVGWFLASLALAGVISATLAWAQSAKFPAQLFTYVEPDGLVRKSDFSAVGREVQAIEAFLGVNGRNLPAQEHCAWLETPQSGEAFTTLWRTATPLTLVQIYCKVTGGTSVAADLLTNDGATPLSVNGAPFTCTPSGVQLAQLNGHVTMATGDRLDLTIGAVAGTCLGGGNVGQACTGDSDCPSSLCTVASLALCFVTAAP